MHGLYKIGDDLRGVGNERQAIRLAVAGASYLTREAFNELLRDAREVDVVAVCTNGKELDAAVATRRPAVVLTDLVIQRAPDADLERILSLRETHPEIGVVLVSHDVDATHAEALFAGGTARRGYLLRERIASKRELVGAIERVARGGSVIDPRVVDALVQKRSRAARSSLASLTRREREVLAEIAAGKSNSAIAQSLVLTKRAIEKHVNSIFAKLGLSETADTSRRVVAALIFLAETRVAASL